MAARARIRRYRPEVRSAIQIPGVAHCALEYQRWAFRSQWRPDGRRFMAIMDTELTIPVQQIHGDLDPYVLVRTLARCPGWAPRRDLVTVEAAGHYAHHERPASTNAAILRLL